MNNVLFTAIIVSLFTAHTQVVDTELVQKLEDVSCFVRIKTVIQTPKGPRRAIMGCSGTYIGPNTVLTAAHCFESVPTDIWVRGAAKDGSHRAKVLKIRPELDLALLKVTGPGHVSAKLAKGNPLKGSHVVNMGSPWGFKFLISDGIIAALGFNEEEFKGTYIIHTGMINPGSSGGGAFNDEGQLVGVNTMSYGGLFGWAGISAAVDTETIRGFLKP